MTTIQGQNFRIEETKFSILAGTAVLNSGQLWDNGQWSIYDPSMDLLGMNIPQLIDPDPVKGHIDQIIANDREAHREHLIQYVGVTPLIACKLWCEGVLVPLHFQNVQESPEAIQIEGVDLGGQLRTLIIAMFEYPYATYDNEGNVV